MLLRAVPKSWFSWNFTVEEGARRLSDIDVSKWREKGMLTIGGDYYTVRREGLVSGAFLLEAGASVIAKAEKPSAFRRSFLIEHAGSNYSLRATSAFGRTFDLFQGAMPVGSISREGIFTRRASVELPDDMPLAVKVFVIWLALVLWKRESD